MPANSSEGAMRFAFTDSLPTVVEPIGEATTEEGHTLSQGYRVTELNGEQPTRSIDCTVIHYPIDAGRVRTVFSIQANVVPLDEAATSTVEKPKDAGAQANYIHRGNPISSAVEGFTIAALAGIAFRINQE